MNGKLTNRIQVGLAVTVLGLGFGLATGTAGALEGCSNSDCGAVLPLTEELPSDQLPSTVEAAPAAQAPAAETSPNAGGVLPFTGADVVELSLVGLGAIGAGTIMVRRSRTRRSQA